MVGKSSLVNWVGHLDQRDGEKWVQTARWRVVTGSLLVLTRFWPSSALRRIQNRKPQRADYINDKRAVTHRVSPLSDGTGMREEDAADTFCLWFCTAWQPQPLFLSFRPGILLPKTNQKHTLGRLQTWSNHSPPCLSTESTPVAISLPGAMLSGPWGWNYLWIYAVPFESTKCR